MGSLLLEASIIGLQTGAVYAVLALGLSLIFGVVRVVNFAHGTMFLISMYIGYYLWAFFGIDPYLAIFVCVPIMFVFGYAVQYILIRPLFLREKNYVVDPMGVLILMAGVDMILTNLAILVFDPYIKSVNTSYASTTIQLGEITLNVTRTLVIPIALLLVFAVDRLLNRSEIGNVIRAVGQNREAAAICGINVHHVYALTFGLALAIGSIGGCVILPFTSIEPTMGMFLGIKAFIVVVLGGLGSIWGMLFAGLLLGIIESLSSAFLPLAYANVIALALFIIIVVVKPTGLMGRIRV